MRQLLFTFVGVMAINMYGFAQYCASNAISTFDSKINQVTLVGNSTTIQSPLSANGTGCSAYTDYTALPAAELSLGLSYNLDILTGTCGSTQFAKYTEAYIDWNNDNDFDDPGEELPGFLSTAFGVIPALGTIAFTVPVTATPGVTTRMRVVCRESGSAATTTPCGTYTWGETEDFSVLILPPGLTALTPDTLYLDCYGDANLSITASGVGGTPPYTYAWSNGSTSSTISGLGVGSYELTITDAVGDMDTAYTEIIEPSPIVHSTTLTQDLICDYDQGVGFVSASGGTPIAESYLWDTTSANFSPDTSMVGTLLTLGDDQTSGLQNIGFDFVFFGDTHSTFSISSNGFIAFDGPSTPNGCCSGQVFPNASTPNNVIALVWDDLWGTNGGGIISYYTIGTAPFRTLIVNFIDVSYCCTATQSVTAQAKLFETTNCIEIHTIDVINASPATQGIENQNGTEAFTYPGRNSSAWSSQGSFISFCAPVGGLSYEWNNGITDTLNPSLTIGNNIVTITDANGCQAFDTIVINPPISTLNLDPDVFDISCFGFNDGEIFTNETGGVSPVAYAWASGETTADLTNLVQGTYSVTATDAVGCLDSVVGMQIIEPDIILSNVSGVTSPACANEATGTAFIVVQGGTAPYNIVWSNGQVGASATNLTEGNYQAIITDSSGCQSVQSVSIVAENPSPIVDLGPKILSATGASVNLNAGNHNSYLWSTGATTQSINVTATGSYWVQVTNSFGCTASDTIYVEIWPTGINDIESDAKFALYPNPATTNLMLLVDANTNLTNVNVNITNVQGQTVMTQSFNSISSSEQVELDVKSLAPGIYNLSVQSDAYKAVRSFVKQ